MNCLAAVLTVFCQLRGASLRAKTADYPCAIGMLLAKLVPTCLVAKSPFEIIARKKVTTQLTPEVGDFAPQAVVLRIDQSGLNSLLFFVLN